MTNFAAFSFEFNFRWTEFDAVRLKLKSSMTKIALNNIGKGEGSQGAIASNQRVKIKQ